MFEPSPQWTDEERKRVVLDICKAMEKKSKEHAFIDPSKIFDLMERIRFILTEPAAFLEKNRKDILTGQPV